MQLWRKWRLILQRAAFKVAIVEPEWALRRGGYCFVRVNLIITIPKTMVKDIPGIKLRSKQVGCTEINQMIAATTSILRLKSTANKLQA